MKIDRAGYPFIAGALVPAAALRRDPPARLGRGVRGCSAASSPTSFAIPTARFPTAAGLVVSPADGTVMIAGPSDEPLGPARADWKQITIFLSPMDVHMNRTPVDGRITRIEYRPGKVPAGLQGSVERQRAERDLDRERRADDRLPPGRRRARAPHRLPRREGRRVERGERIGLMKFGSRMDVFLPPDAEILVSVGQKVVGGETVLARIPLRGGDSAGAPGRA